MIYFNFKSVFIYSKIFHNLLNKLKFDSYDVHGKKWELLEFFLLVIGYWLLLTLMLLTQFKLNPMKMWAVNHLRNLKKEGG